MINKKDIPFNHLSGYNQYASNPARSFAPPSESSFSQSNHLDDNQDDPLPALLKKINDEHEQVESLKKHIDNAHALLLARHAELEHANAQHIELKARLPHSRSSSHLYNESEHSSMISDITKLEQIFINQNRAYVDLKQIYINKKQAYIDLKQSYLDLKQASTLSCDSLKSLILQYSEQISQHQAQRDLDTQINCLSPTEHYEEWVSSLIKRATHTPDGSLIEEASRIHQLSQQSFT